MSTALYIDSTSEKKAQTERDSNPNVSFSLHLHDTLQTQKKVQPATSVKPNVTANGAVQELTRDQSYASSEKRTAPAVRPKPTRPEHRSLTTYPHEKVALSKSAPIPHSSNTADVIHSSNNDTVEGRLSVAKLRDAFTLNPPTIKPFGAAVAVRPANVEGTSRGQLVNLAGNGNARAHESELVPVSNVGAIKSAFVALNFQPGSPATVLDDDDKLTATSGNVGALQEHVPLQCLTKARPKMAGRRAPGNLAKIAGKAANCIPFTDAGADVAKVTNANANSWMVTMTTHHEVSHRYDVVFLERGASPSMVGQNNSGLFYTTDATPRLYEQTPLTGQSAVRSAERDGEGVVGRAARSNAAYETQQYRPRGKLTEVFV